MKYFVAIPSIPKKLISCYEHAIIFNGRIVKKYSFKREIYNWCVSNKIKYRVSKKNKKPGFIFDKKEDFIALKIRWF